MKTSRLRSCSRPKVTPPDSSGKPPGDRNEFFPTVHGFDGFYGNLYHLNAEEEPENVDYLKHPQFKAKFGPRGVMHCFATSEDDPTVDPRFGKMGKQKCEDTGPMMKKRMETVDEEVTKATLDFMEKAHKDGKPFMAWSLYLEIRNHFMPCPRVLIIN